MKTKFSALVFASLLLAGLSLPSASAEIGISVGIAPPAIPVYEQPYCPGEGYLWTPGYWGYADSDYYWVPGVWVQPPRLRVLWTPGYWGYDGSNYSFNEGYWGDSVGFYGGINYGYGYGGSGYYGGEWSGDSFRYNRAVSRVNPAVIHNTYVNKKFATNAKASRVGFNGPGGVTAKASEKEQAVAKTEHIPATSTQLSRAEAAKGDPALHAASNKGKPNAAAMKALDTSNGAPSGAVNGTKGEATNGTAKAEKGNSASRPGQGDATTRTKGAQNNASGKARSTSVHSSHASKATQVKSHSAGHAAIASHGGQHARMATRQGGPGGGAGKAKGGGGGAAKGAKAAKGDKGGH